MKKWANVPLERIWSILSQAGGREIALMTLKKQKGSHRDCPDFN
jgi:hypothetical protein